MSEFPSEPKEAPTRPPLPPQMPQKRGSGVWIALIVAATIVSLACIAATTVIVYAFLQNAPW